MGVDVVTLLSKMGVQVIDSAEGKADIELWKSWYNGYLQEFHEYKIYNGIKYVDAKRSSLKMAKKVCEDWASLLLNEKVKISVVENEKANKTLTTILKKNRFYCMANRLIELSFALGTGAFVESRRSGQVRIDYVRAEYIYPLAVESGFITECAFADVRVNGKDKTYYIQVHEKENGRYKITNALFDSEGNSLELKGCEEIFYSDVPLFQIVTPNKVNTRRTDSPYGASVFSEALDVLCGVDLVYDSFINEFRLGKKRLVVPMSMAKKQMTVEGKCIPVFDSNDIVFYAVEGDTEDSIGLKDVNMELRIEEHIKGLECTISILSDKCGLGSGRYSVRAKDNAVTVKTATEVVSEKSELWQNIRKHENLLEVNLIELAQACMYLSGESAQEIVVNFDDSIIVDTKSELADDIQMVNMAVMAPWELRAKRTGESIDEAKRKCDEIAEGYGEV